jgi:hypothetical protein
MTQLLASFEDVSAKLTRTHSSFVTTVARRQLDSLFERLNHSLFEA